mmetsp:Transcript_823/g.1020  ORF Transcript_823/g.1020 Transcript_823/m.1020 type:complete len:131 (-) Transcript_823:30-422(-)
MLFSPPLYFSPYGTNSKRRVHGTTSYADVSAILVGRRAARQRGEMEEGVCRGVWPMEPVILRSALQGALVKAAAASTSSSVESRTMPARIISLLKVFFLYSDLYKSVHAWAPSVSGQHVDKDHSAHVSFP